MYQEKVVLCVSNAYEKKYYLNPDFSSLPQTIQDELKVMCVLFTEDVGGRQALQLRLYLKCHQQKKICCMMI